MKYLERNALTLALSLLVKYVVDINKRKLKIWKDYLFKDNIKNVLRCGLWLLIINQKLFQEMFTLCTLFKTQEGKTESCWFYTVSVVCSSISPDLSYSAGSELWQWEWQSVRCWWHTETTRGDTLRGNNWTTTRGYLRLWRGSVTAEEEETSGGNNHHLGPHTTTAGHGANLATG